MQAHSLDENRKIIHRLEGGRLAYYVQTADSDYWDRQWTQSNVESLYASAGLGHLGKFERCFTKYLPKRGKIIEAGCGLAQNVLALSHRGYEVEGVDWAPQTIEMVKQRFPALSVRVGNVLNIDVPDDYYAGYISLGVVEHRAEGPEPFLKEAWRVLKPAGTAIFTVPFVNRIRRLKAALGTYNAKPVSGEFYQYAFTKEEFVALVGESGFDVVATGAYDSYKGIFDEFPTLKKLIGRQLGPYHVGSVLQKGLSKLTWIEDGCGHMLLVVARKPGLSGAE